MMSVVGTTREAIRIAQLSEKIAINVVERTTLRMYANMEKTEIGQAGPRVNVPIDVIFMKLIAVMTAPKKY